MTRIQETSATTSIPTRRIKMLRMHDAQILSPAIAAAAAADLEQEPDSQVSTAETVRGCISEHAVAVELTRRYARKLRFCHAAGKWFLWNGQFWQADTTGLT